MATSVVEPQVPVTGEAAPPEKKVAKEKKVRVPKEKKPKQAKSASHPPYFQMIKEALVALNERSGSSPYAIAKFMEEKHKAVLPANFRKTLALQLKNSASKGQLVKVKASYKLSDAGKKAKSAAAAKPARKKPAEKPKREAARPSGRMTTERKAKVAKKKAAAAAKPKQPKSIKSPAAAKKAKKASA